MRKETFSWDLISRQVHGVDPPDVFMVDVDISKVYPVEIVDGDAISDTIVSEEHSYMSKLIVSTGVS